MRFDYILSNPHTLINKYTHLRICYKYFVIRGLPSCWKHSQCAENCVEYGTAVQQDDNRLHRLACHPAAVPYRLNVTCFSCSGGVLHIQIRLKNTKNPRLADTLAERGFLASYKTVRYIYMVIIGVNCLVGCNSFICRPNKQPCRLLQSEPLLVFPRRR